MEFRYDFATPPSSSNSSSNSSSSSSSPSSTSSSSSSSTSSDILTNVPLLFASWREYCSVKNWTEDPLASTRKRKRDSLSLLEKTERKDGRQKSEHWRNTNFLKGVKWSPDGACLCSCDNSNILRIYCLPMDYYEREETWQKRLSFNHWPSSVLNTDGLNAELTIRGGEIVYDFSWYPLMQSTDQATSCLISTSKDHPIHLWDAFYGGLRCSYLPYNHLDELENAVSVSFDPSGSKIYSGFKSTIRVFDVNRPGRQCWTINVARNKKKGILGQNNIVSAFAFNEQTVAAGCYDGSVCFYDDRQMSVMAMLSLDRGITQIEWSPDKSQIAVAARCSNHITLWDPRNLERPLRILERAGETNQRLSISFSPDSAYLASGSTQSHALIYHVESSSASDTPTPITKIGGHFDAVNGVQFHPTLPLLATSTGQRHYPPLFTGKQSSSDAGFSKEEACTTDEKATKNQTTDCDRTEGDGATMEDDLVLSAKFANGLFVWMLPFQHLPQEEQMETEEEQMETGEEQMRGGKEEEVEGKERREQEQVEEEQKSQEQEKREIEKMEEKLKQQQQQQERREQEHAERERQERVEKERQEQERVEKERQEQERVEKERQEQERVEKERQEQERVEKERQEQERVEKERQEQERVEKERREQERKEPERETKEEERVEKRIEQEREREVGSETKEQEGVEEERIKQERDQEERRKENEESCILH